MNVSSMRLFDRLLGVPACAFLTLIRKLMSWQEDTEHVSPRKVLFIKLAEQGSTVLAYRALRLAAERYGRENVYFMVFEDNRFILDALEVVPKENVVVIRENHLWEMMGDTLAALRHVQNAGVDATVDLEFFARSTAVISFLTGARIRVGYHSWSGEGPFRGDLMTHRLFFNHHLHTSDAFQMHVEALEQPAKNLPFFESDIRLSFGCMDRGGPVKTLFELESRDDDYPAIAVSDAEMEGVRSKLEAAGAESVKGRRLVLLNPNCGDMLPLRRWPEENYIALAQGLLDAHGDIVIALTGGPAEAEVVDALSGKISRDRCFSMAGRTTMKELMVLYHLATVLVTNDSGPAHFTSLTPMHSVVLFGPESPALFGSRSSRSHLLWAGTAFTPCVHALNNRETPSEDNSCMSLIPVEDVLATVEGILQRG